MPEFKNREEYEKWKNEKQKGQREKSVDPTKEVKQSSVVKDRSPHDREKSSLEKVFIFVGLGLLVLIPAVIFAWHYMTHGKLSGNIYVTMKSGDVKKAAGIEVYLFTVAQPENLIKEIEQKKMEADLALFAVAKEEMEWLSKEYEMLKQSGESSKRYAFNKDYYNAKTDNTKKEHNKVIGQLLFSGKENKVQTDVNGVYEFQGLKRGKYLLLARHKVFDNKITWLTIAEIKERENKLDLTTNNGTDEIFFDED